MKRRQFVTWIGRTAGAYFGLAAAGGAVPQLLRINSVRLGEARAACTVDTCEADSGLACENRDVCVADSSGTCTSDECTSDKSGNCVADYCTSDSSGECSSDQCASDSSGGCLADRCASDSSGACVSDGCVADSSKECRSDVCREDSSGACRNDICVADSSGECRADICVSDKSGGCVTDRCSADSSGLCTADACRSDSSGACVSDTATNDSSGPCISDNCTSDSSKDCRGDQCTNDSSAECIGDNCTDDADTCPADTTCALDGECLGDGFCPQDGECLEDGGCLIDLASLESGSKADRTAGLNSALKWLYRISGALLCIQLAGAPEPARAATFNVSAGDTAGLITAIQSANGNAEADTINLAAGTYSLNAVDAGNGIAGLPSITGNIVINGSATGTTVIERAGGAPDFGILHVLGSGGFGADDGALTLNNLVIRGGAADIGGGVFNELGELVLSGCTVSGNSGGGIANLSGRLSINNSSIHSNSITGDFSASGGGVLNLAGDQVNVVNSTLYDNSVHSTDSFGSPSSGGGLASLGTTATLTNVTVAGNTATGGSPLGGGVFGNLEMRSSIVADNSSASAPNLAIAPTSLGSNLFGSLDGSFLTLQASDVTGNAALGAFSDDGSPGNGHLPLTAASPAINNGDAGECTANALLATDQIAQPRVGDCDIGAFEFQDLIEVAIPLLGPAGLLILTALLSLLAYRGFGNRPAHRLINR